MELDNIIGQSNLVSQLKKLIKTNKIGHAYAFSGAHGMGKRTIALSFIKDILCNNCESRTCTCISCRTFKEGTNPDFYEVISEKQSIGVDSIRELQSDVENRPTYCNKKVYLIDDADNMTVQAQNCLLKTLEEPPEYVVIILLTVNFEALLSTVQSRTVNLRVNPYKKEEMKRILSPMYSVPKEDLEFIIDFSRGIPQDAIRLIEEGNIRDLRSKIFYLLEKPNDFEQFESIRKSILDNREDITMVFDILLSIYRDCLMYKHGMENMLINLDKEDSIKDIVSHYSSHKLFKKIDRLENLRNSLRYNVNFQLRIDSLLMEIQEV